MTRTRDADAGRPAASPRRFAHEAVAVDPATGAVDETEDQGHRWGFHRFMPSRRPQRPGDLPLDHGQFQMLKVVVCRLPNCHQSTSGCRCRSSR